MGDVLRLSGFLVNPLEIETHIQKLPGIAGCQTIAVPRPEGVRAVSFVILEAGAALDEAAIIAHCRRGLANYKVPLRVFADRRLPEHAVAQRPQDPACEAREARTAAAKSASVASHDDYHNCLLAMRRALRQRLELGPGDVAVDAAAEAAVGRGDDALAADQLGEAADALGHQLGMLDHVGGMAHHAGQDQPVVGQLGVLPHRPLVLVAHVAGLERIGAGVDRQHHVDDVAHGDVGRVRAVPAAPAEMEADAILRQAAQRMVQRLDLGHGELAILLGGRLGIDLVEVLGDRRIVDLQDQAGVDDRLVLLAHGVGAGEDELVVALVVVVADARAARRADRGHEALARRRWPRAPP